MSGHRRRLFGENRRLVHIALFEAYTLTVFQVDGRNQQHSNRVLSGKKWNVSTGLQAGISAVSLV
jgi:hypothetical protein